MAEWVVYDARNNVFWADDTPRRTLPPWEYRIPTCIARPAKVL